MPYKDDDSKMCICGVVLHKWRSTTVYEYTLKERGPGIPPKE